MSEENYIQQLHDQIDRLVNMQNNMIIIVLTLIGITLAVFAFFQWRINSRDQTVITKTAKEETLESLIRDYNLLSITENRDLIERTIDWSDNIHKEIEERCKKINEDLINYEHEQSQKEIRFFYYLGLENQILYAINEELLNEDKIKSLYINSIIDFGKRDGDEVETMQKNLCLLMNLYLEEKIDVEEILNKTSKQ